MLLVFMSKKDLRNTWSQGSLFSSGSSVTFGFTFKPMNHFELIFVYDPRNELQFIWGTYEYPLLK